MGSALERVQSGVSGRQQRYRMLQCRGLFKIAEEELDASVCLPLLPQK
jgi:hypothetical protein